MQAPFNVNCRFKTGVKSQIVPRITWVSSYSLSERNVSSPIFLPEWFIEYHHAYSGKVVFLNTPRKRTIERKKHMVHLYAPGCRFREDTRKSDIPRKESYIGFIGGEAVGLSGLIKKPSKFARFFDPQKLVANILEDCVTLCSEKHESAFWEVQANLSRCISMLLNNTKKISENDYELTSSNAAIDSFVKDAENFMRKNVSVHLKNSDIAAFMNLSESAFTHKFKQKTGESPKIRMMNIKIEMSQDLLLKGKKLKEIAAITGFYDEFHLSKIFKKITGVSPKEFKTSRL